MSLVVPPTLCLIAASAAFVALPLAAQSPGPTVVCVTLDQAIALAQTTKPGRAPRASRSSIRLVARIASRDRGRRSPLASVPNTPFQYGATIPLDITPARVYRARSGRLGVAAADADRRDTHRVLVLNVARAFYDVLLAADRRLTAGQRHDAVRQVVTSDSARVRAGDLAPHNLARSIVELARADASVARAQVDLENARFSLQTLMGVPLRDTVFDAAGSLDYRRIDPPADSLNRDGVARPARSRRCGATCGTVGGH